MDWYALVRFGDVVTGVAMIVLAAAVFWLAPTKRINLLFLWTFLLDGMAVLFDGLSTSAEATVMTIALEYAAAGALFAVPILYLGFVAHAAPVSWTHWLRARNAHLFLLVGAFLIIATVGLSSSSWSLSYEHPDGRLERNFAFWFATMIVLYSLAAAAMIHYFLQADARQRRQARPFLIAAVARDLPYLVLYPVTVLIQTYGLLGLNGYFIRESLWVVFNVVFIAMMTLGVARGQIVDVDRKIHFGLSRGFVAAVVVGAAVGVQTGISEFASDTWGFLAAAVIATLLATAFRPLLGLAERLADVALPKGRGAVGMDARAAVDFYEEQIQVAYSNGSVGQKERLMLNKVCERLGIGAERASAIEASYLERQGRG